MKIKTTYLSQMTNNKHLGLHIHEIWTRDSAYLIRRILNEIMEEILSYGMVAIVKPTIPSKCFEIFLYNEMDSRKLKTIIKRLKERA